MTILLGLAFAVTLVVVLAVPSRANFGPRGPFAGLLLAALAVAFVGSWLAEYATD